MAEIHKRLVELGNPSLAADRPERRREERRQVGLRTITLVSGGVEHRFHMRNISSRGAMGQCDGIVRVGETVRLRFEDDSLESATVRWTKGTRVGVQFISPISPGLFEAPTRSK